MNYSSFNIMVVSFIIFLISFSFTSLTYSITTNNDLYNLDKVSTDSKDSFGSLSRSLVEEDSKNDKGDDDDDDDDDN